MDSVDAMVCCASVWVGCLVWRSRRRCRALLVLYLCCGYGCALFVLCVVFVSFLDCFVVRRVRVVVLVMCLLSVCVCLFCLLSVWCVCCWLFVVFVCVAECLSLVYPVV